MSESNNKFILMHIGSKDSEEFLTDAIINQGIERGLILKSNLGQIICRHFSMLKEKGYFPVGIIVDEQSENVEFLFNRHPQQTSEMKLAEYKHIHPTKL
jgi:hypothetical protein